MLYKCIGGPLDGKEIEKDLEYSFFIHPIWEPTPVWAEKHPIQVAMKHVIYQTFKIRGDQETFTILVLEDLEPDQVLRMLIDGYKGEEV